MLPAEETSAEVMADKLSNVCAECGQVVNPVVVPPPPPAMDIIQMFNGVEWDWHFLSDDRITQCEANGWTYRVCHIPGVETDE